ncbi:MAG: hypothetical protein A2X08_07740 [Bacteroidetes bacterium GWA2_32_17]|nr:MAG: hypothetical protein A2X08_07740 [Bacteroidetes bacterium GWA2_32_17]
MKTTTSVICLLFVIFLISATLPENNSLKILNIEDAINKGIVKAEVSGKGGHGGECINLNITNLSSVDTTIYVEAGRRLNSEDSTVQDILIVKELPILVKAGEEKNVNLLGFCCQATNHSPSKGEKFDIGHLADSELFAIAQFLNKNPFDEDIMQNAVWVVSNNHPLSSVGSSNQNKRKELKKLHNVLAAIKHLPEDFSWYSLTFKTDTAKLFSGVPDSLYGDIEYSVWNNCEVSITLSDSIGHVVKRFMVNKPHNPNKYNYEIKTSVYGYQKGKYFVRLFTNNQMKLEKTIEL